MSRSAVEIVLTNEDDGRIFYGGQVESFMRGADVRRAVAEETDRHPIQPSQFEADGGSGCDGHVGADDGIGRRGVDRHIRQMHLPALASRATGGFPPKLGGDLGRRTALGQKMAHGPVRAEHHVVACRALQTPTATASWPWH